MEEHCSRTCDEHNNVKGGRFLALKGTRSIKYSAVFYVQINKEATCAILRRANTFPELYSCYKHVHVCL